MPAIARSTHLLPGLPGKGVFAIWLGSDPVSLGMGALKRDDTGLPWVSSKLAI